jgi:MoaE-MoaD fusion protein
MVAVNGEYAEMTVTLHDGDEVALIPPVSGGSEKMAGPAANRQGRVREFQAIQITDMPLDAAPLIDYVRADQDGAVVTFYGVTRDHNEGRRVKYLEYEAYEPMATRKIEEIIAEMKLKWEIGRVSVAHRTGRVNIGETSMVLAVSAPHRRPAFEAALYFVDRLKEIVPIWKKEYFEGGDVWIGEAPGKAVKSARQRP